MNVEGGGRGCMCVCVCVCVCVCQTVGCKSPEHGEFLAYCMLEANSIVWNISHNVFTNNDVNTAHGRCCRQNCSLKSPICMLP